MDITELLTGVFKQYPYLVMLGPLIGFYLSILKKQGKLQGFTLLAASVGLAACILAAFGYANGWQAGEWRQVPFVALVVVALSNLTTTTKEHIEDKIAVKTAVPEDEPDPV